jgi:DNA primase small subunit
MSKPEISADAMDVVPAKRWTRGPRNGDRMEYYAHFPLKEVMQFMNLNRERDDDFLHRELSLCFSEADGRLIWSRFRSFPSGAEFKQYVRRMQPTSINMGALGFSPAALWRTETRSGLVRDAFYESEIMLDVDIKDYDDVRSCNCTGSRVFDQKCPECGMTATTSETEGERMCTCEWERFANNICVECWKFAQCGMIVLDYILRKHWGLVDFFFVFSGMKGFHCWIMDDTFRSFSAEQRKDFADSFDPWTGADRMELKYEKSYQDPLYGKDFDEFLLLLFTEVIVARGVFDIRHVNTRTKIVEYFEMRDPECESKSEALRALCDDATEKGFDSPTTWKKLMEFNFRTNDHVKAKSIQRRFVYAYVYPRIDGNVTTQLKHLRKMPWSPHPRSECIAVPILPVTAERIFEFTPRTAPTLRDLDAVHKITGQFALALDLMSIRLDHVLYCEDRFPTLPPMQELLDLGEEGRIFRELDGWVLRNVGADSLFYEPQRYQRHGAKCRRCHTKLAMDRQNTLLSLIVRASWIDGVYYRMIEESMKLSLASFAELCGFLSVPQSLWERIQVLRTM